MAKPSDETPLALTRRARRTNKELAALYPDAHCELDFTTPLDAVKDVKNKHGVTVNDVVVAICAGAVRRWRGWLSIATPSAVVCWSVPPARAFRSRRRSSWSSSCIRNRG